MIVIPGADGMNNKRPFGAQLSTSLHSVKFYTELNKEEYDYGAIFLPDRSLYEKVGSFFSYAEYEGHGEVLNSGYPRDKKHEQWKCAGKIKSETFHLLKYDIDTKRGNSGSPIMEERDGRYLVVGIHRAGDCPNECIRINSEIISVFKKWEAESNK